MSEYLKVNQNQGKVRWQDTPSGAHAQGGLVVIHWDGVEQAP